LDCWQNHKPHPLLDQYRFLQTHWGIDSQPMTELMEAMRDEQGEVRFATEKELLTYSHGVAGTIGWMTSPMLGVTDSKALKHAIDLGIAMQLTNIARDIFEDAERDRVYLPAEYLNSPITPAELRQPGHSGRLEEVLAAKARLIDLAEEYYASGEAGMRYLPLRMRIVIRWAASMYRSIGLLIKKNPRIFERKRAVVGWMKKTSSLPRCLFLSFFPGIPK
jgi:phytoene synthase